MFTSFSTGRLKEFSLWGSFNSYQRDYILQPNILKKKHLSSTEQ